MQISLSNRTSSNSSQLSRLWSITSDRHLFIMPIRCSKKPPHQGARVKLNFHLRFSIPMNLPGCGPFWWGISSSHECFAVITHNGLGTSSPGSKFFKALWNSMADRLRHSFKWTALVLAQVNSAMYAFAVFDFIILKYTGPAKSTLVTTKGSDSLVLKSGSLVSKIGEVDNGFLR